MCGLYAYIVVRFQLSGSLGFVERVRCFNTCKFLNKVIACMWDLTFKLNCSVTSTSMVQAVDQDSWQSSHLLVCSLDLFQRKLVRFSCLICSSDWCVFTSTVLSDQLLLDSLSIILWGIICQHVWITNILWHMFTSTLLHLLPIVMLLLVKYL
jgi:hypothetical protein